MTRASPSRDDDRGKGATAPAEATEPVLKPIKEAVAPPSGNLRAPAVAVGAAEVSPRQPARAPAAAALLCVSAGLGLAVLTTWIVGHGTHVPALDESVHRWVVEHRTPASLTIARVVTLGGVTSLVLPALVVVGSVAAAGDRDYVRRFRTGLLVTAVASVGVYAGLRLNAVVGRGRPPVADWAAVAGGPAFPSGHTSCATLVALAAAWVIAGRVRAGWPRVVVWMGAGVWAFGVGVTRVWLGVHWPTDVCGGWLFGLAWFAGCAAVVAALGRRSWHGSAPVGVGGS